jgi:hypothetical protein
MTPITKALFASAVAAVFAVAGAGAAFAQDATASTWLNVRAGPSAAFAVQDTLYPGEPVSIEECEPGGWCRITHSGPDGWVNSSYLEPVTGSGGGPATPDCRFQLTLGPGGPTLSIVCDGGGSPGGGGGGGGGAPPATTDRACFFDGPNFTGDSFCRNVGIYPTLPAAANDRITSVQLEGNAKVRLCEDTNMGPYCRDLTTSENQLGAYLNNKVSSLRVYTGTLPAMKQACFFDGPAYTGEHFCMRPGTVNVFPPAANDKVTSVAVFAGAKATLCVNTNLGGYCRTMNTNVPVLGPLLNDKASSVFVE